MENRSRPNTYARSDMDTLPNTSASHRYDAPHSQKQPQQQARQQTQSHAQARPQPSPKYNLKNLLFPPGRLTRPKKLVSL